MAQCDFGKTRIMTTSKLYSGARLTTGDKHDPLLPKLIQAINHASEIEITVSFIQPSGLDLLFEPLLDALKSGASIKLLTSDYLTITSPVALRKLRLLQERGAQTRIFECQQGKSFHMKSYIFVKTEDGNTMEGCAWVGSNNISRTALLDAHEWCLRHDYEAPVNSPAALEFNNIRIQFTAIFDNSQSRDLTDTWISDYAIRHERNNKKYSLVTVDKDFRPEDIEPPTPNSIQEIALEALCQTRKNGYKRGLVVLATGMGKTWLSAFDAQQLKAKKVLFVAHREEILLQAERTFIQLVDNANTGLYNSENKDAEADYLFASIQTLGKLENLKQFATEHFDYIIVDEFHHASAPTYKNLLAYFQPLFLLGLTATPERSDQADILSLCDNNLVLERNLVHGIDEKILVPFNYYGIYDEYVDYQEIPWRNGKFEPTALDNAFATQKRAVHIFTHWEQKKQTRTLAFCVSKKHADFMAHHFNSKGIKAIAVYSGSEVRRNEALSELEKGNIDIIFSVDLFNEGTDLPSIDTILMLRPSESKILFLQQLGRGLRQSQATDKNKLIVIDFIGNHQSFLNKPASLLDTSSSKEIVRKIKEGVTLTDSCFINYDLALITLWEKLAKAHRSHATTDFTELKQQLGHRPTATEFFHHGYENAKVRKQCGSWFALVAEQEQEAVLSDLLSKHSEFLLKGVESTNMSKCFKGILLEAFLELDGFNNPPTTQALAERSLHVLNRRPDLKTKDVAKKEQACNPTDELWHKYWLKNPINAFTTANKNGEQWFTIEKGTFSANFTVDVNDTTALHELMQELVDLRLAEYIQRLDKRDQGKKTTQQEKAKLKLVDSSVALVRPDSEYQKTALPFYPDLKIACGHFKTGNHDDEETIEVPHGYGNLDPLRHFVAPASGNSMNGGKNAIKDGDLLLLEWVTPTSAGSISNNTMAIEIQDDAGDNQYLLRIIRKKSDGHYHLEAQNSDYTDMIATDEMKTFARLRGVINPLSHQKEP